MGVIFGAFREVICEKIAKFAKCSSLILLKKTWINQLSYYFIKKTAYNGTDFILFAKPKFLVEILIA